MFMSNQSKTITLKNGKSLTASVKDKDIELKSDGTSEIIPRRKASPDVEHELGSDPGGIIGFAEINDLKEAGDGSIALVYSDKEAPNLTVSNFIVCLCDKRVGKGWQVCEKPIVKSKGTITSITLTEQPNNDELFTVNVTGTDKDKKQFQERRGH